MAIQSPLSSIVTVRTLARYLQVHPSTVYRLAKQGCIPAFKIGSDWRFNREDIDRWRLAQTGDTAVPLEDSEEEEVARPTAGRSPSSLAAGTRTGRRE